jgi:hypothetical protein
MKRALRSGTRTGVLITVGLVILATLLGEGAFVVTHVQASGNITVTLHPTSGLPGSSVSVSATGFAAIDSGAHVDIYFDSQQVGGATVSVCAGTEFPPYGFGEDCGGGPMVVIVVPADASPGSHTIEADSGQVCCPYRPKYQGTAAFTVTAPPSPTPTPTTIPVPTATSTIVPTPTVTSTEIVLPTATWTAVAASTATSTAVLVPTATSTSISVPSATSTSIPLPTTPTNTPFPMTTPTSTPVPTSTSPPVPTAVSTQVLPSVRLCKVQTHTVSKVNMVARSAHPGNPVTGLRIPGDADVLLESRSLPARAAVTLVYTGPRALVQGSTFVGIHYSAPAITTAGRTVFKRLQPARTSASGHLQMRFHLPPDTTYGTAVVFAFPAHCLRCHALGTWTFNVEPRAPALQIDALPACRSS